MSIIKIIQEDGKTKEIDITLVEGILKNLESVLLNPDIDSQKKIEEILKAKEGYNKLDEDQKNYLNSRKDDLLLRLSNLYKGVYDNPERIIEIKKIYQYLGIPIKTLIQ